MKSVEGPPRPLREMGNPELGKLYDQDQISDHDYLLGVIFGMSNSKLLDEYRKLSLQVSIESTRTVEGRVHHMTLHLLVNEIARRDLERPETNTYGFPV